MSKKSRSKKNQTPVVEQTEQQNPAPVVEQPNTQESAPAEAPKLQSRSIVPAGYRETRCVVDKEHRTARGNVSVHCGDRLAVFLRGKDLEAVYKLAEQHLPGGNELRARYANLNTGQQRMNVGNRLRAALKDGLWTIPQ